MEQAKRGEGCLLKSWEIRLKKKRKRGADEKKEERDRKETKDRGLERGQKRDKKGKLKPLSRRRCWHGLLVLQRAPLCHADQALIHVRGKGKGSARKKLCIIKHKQATDLRS